MRQPTAEQKAKAQARREEFKKLVKQVAAMSDEQRQAMFNQAGIITCEGHSLSMTNTLLTTLQNPSATVVGGFRQWLKHNRAVRKGEHGISIWIPTATKRDEDSETSDLRFLMATVFDVSQTEEIAAQAA